MTTFPSLPARPPLVALALAAVFACADAAATTDPAEAAAWLAAAVPPSSEAIPAVAPRGPFAARAVGAKELGRTRGGNASSDTVGSLRNTTATNVDGGANTVRDGSFANAAGLTTVIQNSGSNVLIQNSTTVNVQFRP